jgi:hypothetical protein
MTSNSDFNWCTMYALATKWHSEYDPPWGEKIWQVFNSFLVSVSPSYVYRRFASTAITFPRWSVSIFNILLQISEKERNWYLQIVASVTNLSANNLKCRSGKLILPETAEPQTIESQFSSSKLNVQTVLELVKCIRTPDLNVMEWNDLLLHHYVRRITYLCTMGSPADSLNITGRGLTNPF